MFVREMTKPATPTTLMTAQSVNLRFAALKERFVELGMARPVPFIIWGNRLSLTEADRLRQAFCARATRADAYLLAAVERTLSEVARGANPFIQQQKKQKT